MHGSGADSLRQAQADMLRLGRPTDRLFHHLLLGNDQEVVALRGTLGDSLWWRVLCEPMRIDASATTMDLAAANADPWLARALARIFLQRDDVPRAVQVAKLLLQHGAPDTSVLVLVGRFLLSRERHALAAKVLESALHIGPDQRDVAALFQAAARGASGSWNVNLAPLPALERVGFYLPLHNVADHVLQAIEGVLAQSYPLHEIVVVDDGSTDGSADMAARYPVRVIRHESNRGLAAARNTAFGCMAADYVATVDTDVVPEPGYTQYALMNFEDRGAHFAGTGGRLIEAHTDNPADHWRSRFLSQDGGKLPWYMDTPPPPDIALGEEDAEFYHPDRHFLPGCNTVFRRASVLAVGGYDEACRTNGEDVALCAAFKRGGYHYAFTPHAIARHQRRDTPASALHTAWRYAFHLRESQGYYDRESGLAALLEQHVARARFGFEKDVEDNCLDCLFIDLLYLFHCHARDAAHMVEKGVLASHRSMHIAGVLLAEFAPLDARYGGDCCAGIAASLTAAGYLMDGPPSVRGVPHVFREGVAGARDWFATIGEEAYEALVAHL